MSEDKDSIGYITINGSRIGIVGRTWLLEEAKSRKFATEEELARFLLAEVKKRNYIPSVNETEYAKVFLREYKRFTGALVDEDVEEGILQIKILGPGCVNCQRLEQETISALAEMNISADVEHIKEPKEIGKYGVMGVPALIINNKPKSMGKTLSKEQIKRLIAKELIKKGDN